VRSKKFDENLVQLLFGKWLHVIRDFNYDLRQTLNYINYYDNTQKRLILALLEQLAGNKDVSLYDFENTYSSVVDVRDLETLIKRIREQNAALLTDLGESSSRHL